MVERFDLLLFIVRRRRDASADFPAQKVGQPVFHAQPLQGRNGLGPTEEVIRHFNGGFHFTVSVNMGLRVLWYPHAKNKSIRRLDDQPGDEFEAMRAANARGEALKLDEDELAFYDALEVNDSAVKVLGEPTLVKIARELVETVKKNVTIDWTMRENVQAQLRVYVKRILRKYGYPPDMQEQATQTVLAQAKVLSEVWAIG